MGQLEPGDFYIENGLLVFTAAYHERRGSCCGNACRHCPYAHVNVRADAPAGPPPRD
ncbi:MAG: hypothetical protein NVSMB19_25910 [Vulcanimicrobiaceae bacterium]